MLVVVVVIVVFVVVFVVVVVVVVVYNFNNSGLKSSPVKKSSAISLYYKNFGLGQTLKWMTGIHRIEWLAFINVALKRCQTELFHLSFKCSVHCLVISHHPFFIIFSGYLLRERVRGTKIWDSSTTIQFNSFQVNSIQCSASIIES